MAFCLIVEDEPRQVEALAGLLRGVGHEVVTATDGQAARNHCDRHRPEVLILDLGLPDVNGLTLIPQVLQISPLTRVIVVTGLNDVRTAVHALQAGARHYLVKPWDAEELLVVVAREARTADNEETRARISSVSLVWGQHQGMQEVRAAVGRLAAHPRTPVLIEGETGTGKEMVAWELHTLTGSGGPFVPLNCAAVPHDLLESELFGHERGAFTGADRRRRGLAELARDGTLFLDEVGELPLALQAKLLRFLQDHRFRRVGGESEVESQCRVVAATHRNLEELQRNGTFREDLFYRLAVVRLKVPPLRERRDDIPVLADHLLRTMSAGMGIEPRAWADDARRALVLHTWPGNVRELRNRIERALVLADGASLSAKALDLDARRSAAAVSPEVVSEEPMLRVLEEERWNISRAARRLGIPRHVLRYAIEKAGISRPPRVPIP